VPGRCRESALPPNRRTEKVNFLLDGTESRPIAIAGLNLKGMLLEYDASTARQGRLEIWAHN
jgi:hypothetical protein